MSGRKPWEETWEVGPAGIETENRIPVLVDEFGVFENADARLAAAAPELVRALLRLEWVGHDFGDYCVLCGAAKGGSAYNEAGNHIEGCELLAALRKAGVIE